MKKDNTVSEDFKELEEVVPPAYLVGGLPIWVIDDLLDNSQHDYMLSYCIDSLYSPKHSSDYRLPYRDQRLVSRLTSQQVQDLFLTEVLQEVCKAINEPPIEILEAYINIYTPDSTCLAHIDSPSKGLTFLYYPNTLWDINWGGETIFFDNNKEAVFTSIYKPNRLVVFDPRIMHLAKTPSILSESFRYTIAYKGGLNDTTN